MWKGIDPGSCKVTFPNLDKDSREIKVILL